jgi:hypothetical protein
MMRNASRPYLTARRTLTGAIAVAACLTGAAGVSTATAAPTRPQAAPVKWSPELGPVPGASTNTAPALADVSVGKNRSNLLLFWTGPADGTAGFHIAFSRSLSLRNNSWTKPGLVASGKPLTRSRPAASPIGGPASGQVIVVWKDAADSHLFYSVGEENKNGALKWSGIAQIPGASAASAPAVYQPLHSNLIVVTWRAAAGHAVDYITGIPGVPGAVKWQDAASIPRAMATGTPAIAEVSTGGESGLLYALWQVPGNSGQIDFATAPEPVRGQAKWSTPRPLPASVKTAASPSAQAIGRNLTYPLLIVFRPPRGSALSYVTLSAGNKVTRPLAVPHLRSSNGTAISPGVLAAEDPGQIFYEPYVRPCAGC